MCDYYHVDYDDDVDVLVAHVNTFLVLISNTQLCLL